MNLHAVSKGFDLRHFSRRKARHLAVDVSIAVAALILWALLSHMSSPRFLSAGDAEDCVYLGRAGADCVEKTNAAGADVSSKRQCEFLGRAGKYCAPETKSR